MEFSLSKQICTTKIKDKIYEVFSKIMGKPWKRGNSWHWGQQMIKLAISKVKNKEIILRGVFCKKNKNEINIILLGILSSRGGLVR